jgi:hypothetical protein
MQPVGAQNAVHQCLYRPPTFWRRKQFLISGVPVIQVLQSVRDAGFGTFKCNLSTFPELQAVKGAKASNLPNCGTTSA